MHQARPVTGGRMALAKFFAYLVICSLTLALAACGGSGDSGTDAATQASLLAISSHSQNVSLPAPNAQPAEVEGELLVLHEDDFKNKTSRTRHFLKTAKGQVELQFKGKAPQLTSGAKMRIKGEQTGNVLAVSATDSTSLVVTAPAPLPNTLGEHKTLVLLVNFQDNTTQPFTLASANNLVFTQIGNFFKENSYQQTSITGAGYGWYTLPIASTCVFGQIATYAKQAATAAGINVADYSHFVYFFPHSDNCWWSGMATVGGTTGEVWVNGWQEAQVAAHELGHNFGLYHSHAQECGATAIGSACTNYEYGDTGDIMGETGTGHTGHFNAFQKERLGWLNSGALPPVTTVQTSGSYTLDPYETPGTNPKALKILKSIDSTTGARTWYYVEYRTALGFDQSLAALFNSNFTSGVVIHSGSESSPDTSNLLDMTPNTTTSFDWNNPALAVGQSFTDSSAGVTITSTGVNGSNAGVSVSFSQPACGRASPVLTPATQSQSAAAGTTITYSVTLTNNDKTACGTSSFALQAAPPAGWSASISPSSLSIAPGASASVTLSVTAPASATGDNPIAIGAVNGAAASYAASASATYQVVTGLAVSAATDKASYAPGQTVVMTSTVKSGAAAVAGASVTFTINQPNGGMVTQTATTNASGIASASYRLGRKNATGSYQLRAYASGLSLNGSGSAGFTVQ